MKIRTKLIVSFLIILLAPLLFAGITLFGFKNLQMRAIQNTYQLDNVNYSVTNTLQLLNRLTESDYNTILETAENDVEKLEDTGYLEELQESLGKKYSYLVVRKDDTVIFNGGQDNDEVLQELPDYENSRKDAMISTYLDSKDEILVKQIDFEFADGTRGSAFILTTSQSIVPEVKSLLWQFFFAIIVILILTATILIAWTYSSIVGPLAKLQSAAENIKNGNLDFELDYSDDDEIGELCVTFEEMRRKLKENADEKINAEKENRMLVSNIAHDLKTPITSIKGYSEGILDGVANTPEKMDHYMRTIYNKANEMDKLINELTLYSKIDTNRIPYNFTRLNLAGYFDDCVEEIGLDLEEKGIKLHYDNRVDSNVEIIADPEQLHRVIANIVGNSVKYMDKENGTIDIRLKDVGDFIQIEMEDNGKGIGQKDLPYIFDRFYRTDSSRNSSTGGSGIGLSIVKKIIEDHGGKIWATSKEGTGTCMTFVIRKYMEQPAAK